ncbi:PAS domain-containing sensor histidine kinase [Desulfatiferula olefinivorans]
MKTYFAPAERADREALDRAIEQVSTDPVMTGLLRIISGLIAVLDEHRQIVAVNDAFLDFLGIANPAETLGLRPGEAVGCVYADLEPGGCGTSQYCSTCGAAIAIVSSLGLNEPVERTCALRIRQNDEPMDLALSVRSQPVDIEGRRFLLLFLQDITRRQQQDAIERMFFHDINNMLSALSGASEMLLMDSPSRLARIIHQVSFRLFKEMAIQRCLSRVGTSDYEPSFADYSLNEVIGELSDFFANHPAAQGKHLDWPQHLPDVRIRTDAVLLSRVLSNMVINALEAGDRGDRVKLWAEQNGSSLSMCVWNKKEIPEGVARRIFQRHFSTKNDQGRGLGTYSMKLFGEKMLGGTVSFTTSAEEGTVFRFTLDCYIP